MVAEIVLPTSSDGHLRRLDMRRDLARVADLVELCFQDTLDPEGKQYLKDMRRVAQNSSWLGWASTMIDEGPMPPSGYIWEEQGQLVGNLSLIPISVHGKKSYMIANVATHPDYRNHGIAFALTLTALEHARQQHASTVWLQVRDDNPAAIHIYERSGFKERLRRTSWFSGPLPENGSISQGFRVGKRRAGHWELQRSWLKRLYPPELEWHIPMEWDLFRAGFWGSAYRLLNGEFPQHWSVEQEADLKGVLTWRHTGGFTDPIWLALPEAMDEAAVLNLLSQGRASIKNTQPLGLNYPAGLAVGVLRQAGFYTNQTLIWMEYPLSTL